MRRIGFILFTVAVLVTLVKLGLWQVSRALEKQSLNIALQYRSEQMYYSLANLPVDPRWYSLTLHGEFDHDKAVLLDNQTYHGRVGYHVLYPLQVDGSWVLVNLGWVGAPAYREQIPALPKYHGKLRVAGVIAPPSNLIELKSERLGETWPLRVQNLHIGELSEKMGLPLEPWVLQIDPADPIALQQTWTPIVMEPQKHYAYAVQWFLMAVAISGLAAWWLRRSNV